MLHNSDNHCIITSNYKLNHIRIVNQLFVHKTQLHVNLESKTYNAISDIIVLNGLIACWHIDIMYK